MLLATALRAQDPGAEPREEKDIEQQRSEWFYGERAYPHRYVPARARLKALEDVNARAALISPTSVPSWTFVGPQPTSTPWVQKHFRTCFRDCRLPESNNTVYLGAAQGGIWKTTDGGNAWTELTDTQASLATGSILIDPTNTNTIYAGTGEENFAGDSYYGAGILKSTDGGTTWTNYPGPFAGPVGNQRYHGGGARIGNLAISPSNDAAVAVGRVPSAQSDGSYHIVQGHINLDSVVSS